MSAKDGFNFGKIDAEGLVGGDITLDPLDIRAQALIDLIGFGLQKGLKVMRGGCLTAEKLVNATAYTLERIYPFRA